MKHFLFVLFLFFALVVSAQDLLKSEYSYRRYTTQDGLPSMIMQTVFKDSKGLLWQGTLKGGSRFDGFNFKPYALDIFPNVDRIEEINGKVRFWWDREILYPETGKYILVSDSIRLNPYNSWILPANNYIFENFEGKKYFVKLKNDSIAEVVDIPQLQALNRCKVYLDNQQNTLYIPNNRTKSVCIYNINAKTFQTIENVVIESFINHSSLGLLGIGSEGIYKIVGNRAEMYVPLHFDMQNKMALEAQNGDLYIKDFFNIYRISGKKTECLHHNVALTVWDMVLDNDDNLWVATSKGLYNYFHFDFKNYEIPNHTIKYITQDNNGTYWFAGDNENIFSMKDGIFSPVNYALNSKISSVSFSGAKSFGSSVYFLIRGGVLIHENNQFHWAEIPSDNQTYQNIVKYKDNLLVCGSTRITEITPQGKLVKNHTPEELKIEPYYCGLAVDNAERIIAGSGDSAIAIIDNGKINILTAKNALFSSIIVVDNQNHTFAAAKKYLNLIDNNAIKTIYSFDNDYITGLLPFDSQNMLISTLKGFYIFNSKKYFENDKIQLLFYDHNNGMNGIEPAFNALFLDNNKKVWMVMSENIISFDPYKLLRQIAPPNLFLQNIAISKDNIKWKNIENNTKPHFSYKENTLKFTVIGIKFSAAENVRYHYRLLGFQNQWSEPTKQREVTFNNLPPGSYTFEIYADAGTDESRSETKTFSFTIKPAFWQTSWFLILAIIFVSSLSFLSALIIFQRKNRSLLEKLRTEKGLNELKISSIRLKAIPHFNANVLSAIEYYFMNKTKDEAMNLLSLYSNFTCRTLIQIDRASRSITEEIEYASMYLDLEKIRFREKFDYRIEIDDNVNENIHLPNMILHTWTENAVKHGFAGKTSGGKITISAVRNENSVTVSVADNGAGRAIAAQNRNIHSTKQGLSILERQIEIYNRFNEHKIKLLTEDLFEGENAAGTRFSIEVPDNYQFRINNYA